MPLAGQEKIDNSFVRYRAEKQTKLWSKLVKGEVEGLDISKVDPEILACCLEGKYFRSEGHFGPPDGTGRRRTPMEELWFLYIGVENLTEEEEQRGKARTRKKSKVEEVEPIKARRIVYTQVRDKKGKPVENEFTYGVHFHDDGYLDFPAWLYARDQAKKDLLWLNQEVLGNTLVLERVHRVICDQFVSKDFDGVYGPGYTVTDVTSAINRQNRVPTVWNPATKNYEPRDAHEIEDPLNYSRMSLTQDSRDFFKSTISRADAVQWMLACPDISMIILCADNELAEIFVNEIKVKFFLAAGATPSPLHLLFPEYVLRGAKGTSNEPIECPARRIDRPYHTLRSESIESTLSGLHCDVLKFDDVVSNNNCLTDITRKKLQKHINLTMSICDTWGWIDMIGTRYYPDDYYGFREIKFREDPDTFAMKMFVRACWEVKPEFSHIGNKRVKELKEHMVNLTFPEHASWKFLQGKLIDEYEFRCQYLNEPVWGEDAISMPIELLRAHPMSIIEARTLKGDVLILGDMAKEAKKNSDYTAFVAIKVFKKRNPETNEQTGPVAAVVLEVAYGRWLQSQIAAELARLNQDWLPRVIRIEDTGGLESFKMYAIPEAFRKTGLPYYHITWAPVEQGFDAKRNRIKSLEVLLKSDRLYFAVASWNEEAFTQLSQYTGAKSTRSRKDDIPDAMSFISRCLPSSTPASPEQQQQDLKEAEKQLGARLLEAQHEMMFGRRNVFRPTPVELPEPPANPGSSIAQKIFGGNGLRG